MKQEIQYAMYVQFFVHFKSLTHIPCSIMYYAQNVLSIFNLKKHVLKLDEYAHCIMHIQFHAHIPLNAFCVVMHYPKSFKLNISL